MIVGSHWLSPYTRSSPINEATENASVPSTYPPEKSVFTAARPVPSDARSSAVTPRTSSGSSEIPYLEARPSAPAPPGEERLHRREPGALRRPLLGRYPPNLFRLQRDTVPGGKLLGLLPPPPGDEEARGFRQVLRPEGNQPHGRRGPA